MSDTPRMKGWWQASDGKWYPPESHPEYKPPPPPPPSAERPPAPPPAETTAFRPRPQGGRLQQGWRKFRGFPTWAQVGLWILLGLIVIGAANAGNTDNKETVSSQAPTTFPVAGGAQAPTAPPATTSQANTTRTPTTAATATTRTPTSPPTTAAPVVPAPIRLQGSGKTATQPFPIAGGLVTFHSTHQGSSNFIVKLATPQGESVGASLVNEIGAFDGVAARNVSAGQYIFNVEASGAWVIEVEQPRPTSGDKLPVSYDGKGPAVMGPLTSSGGGIRFALKHSGASNFIVKLLNKEGQSVGSSLVNEIGASDVSQVRAASAGLYYLSIEADGVWHVDASAT